MRDSMMPLTGFESSVNSYGGQTRFFDFIQLLMFESSVNSYGGQTDRVTAWDAEGLRVV